MDFNLYLAGERLHPPYIPSVPPLNSGGYFSSQPLHGGVFGYGDELGRRQLQGMELGRERMADDMVQRRLLEEEVRRDLALERAASLRRRGLADGLLPPTAGAPGTVGPQPMFPDSMGDQLGWRPELGRTGEPLSVDGLHGLARNESLGTFSDPHFPVPPPFAIDASRRPEMGYIGGGLGVEGLHMFGAYGGPGMFNEPFITYPPDVVGVFNPSGGQNLNGAASGITVVDKRSRITGKRRNRSFCVDDSSPVITVVGGSRNYGATATVANYSIPQPTTKEPLAKEPSTQEPLIKEPLAKGPSTQESLIKERHVNEQPTKEPSPNESLPQPSTGEPSIREPSVNEPSTTKPSFKEPSSKGPSLKSVKKPSTTEQSAKPSTKGTPVKSSKKEPSTKPSTVKPSTKELSTKPSIKESTREPLTEEPSTKEPSATAPSTKEPSTKEPSATAPSTKEPSSAEPSTMPSIEEPLTKDLPTKNSCDTLFKCSLCNVTTTSKHCLDAHLGGRRHMAMMESDSKKPLVTGSSSKKKNGQPMERPPKRQKVMGGRKYQKFWCDICNLYCSSSNNLESHLKGKKHMATVLDPSSS